MGASKGLINFLFVFISSSTFLVSFSRRLGVDVHSSTSLTVLRKT